MAGRSSRGIERPAELALFGRLPDSKTVVVASVEASRSPSAWAKAPMALRAGRQSDFDRRSYYPLIWGKKETRHEADEHSETGGRRGGGDLRPGRRGEPSRGWASLRRPRELDPVPVRLEPHRGQPVRD